MTHTVWNVFTGAILTLSSVPPIVQSFQTRPASSGPWPSLTKPLIDSTPIAEVVGAGGRIGSFILNQAEVLSDGRETGRMVAVPRDEAIGASTEVGKPIFVAVPATEIPEVIERTEYTRLDDLVFVTNGIPSDFLSIESRHSPDPSEVTTSVPHFGVLKVGGEIVSSSESPPTVIHGKHAGILSDMLQRHGVHTKIVDSVEEVDKAAVRKLIWVSIMWLLCHDNFGSPLTVAQVHQDRPEDVHDLVAELAPVTNTLLSTFNAAKDNMSVGTTEEMIDYLQSYSNSIPDAVVNKMLSIDEFAKRNGMLLGVGAPQPNHRNLVKRVVGYIPNH